jgi:anti-sigma B factor antagonist
MPIKARSKNFSISIRQSGPVSLIDLSGHFTSFEAGALSAAVESLVKQKRNRILLNLRGLDYLDSSGVGELVRNYVSVIKSGGEMKVVGLASKIEEILKITQLYKVFPEFPDEDAALRSFPAPHAGSDEN